MKSRYALGYVVQIDGIEITLNLLDMHRGQLASHAFGVTPVTEIGSLLALDSGGGILVMKVLSQSFAEPKEAHRAGVGTSTHQTEPLRHVRGVVVGRLVRAGGRVSFVGDSISTPPLGADAFPLSSDELAAVLGPGADARAPILLGDDIRGGGKFRVGLSDLVSRHVAVLGSSGQGKSCFTAAVMQQVVRLPGSRIVVFDINGEYEDAFRVADLPEGAVKVTKIGGAEAGSFRLPYYALGRFGLNRLLIPSDRTQRPALAFALESLNRVRWFPAADGVGLSTDDRAHMFDDCRQGGAGEAYERITALREGAVRESDVWPHMNALSALIAESHAIAPNARGGLERNAFNYGNVSPLITRIRRLVDDPMFTDVVDVEGGRHAGRALNWQTESTALVEQIFGATEVPWRVHIVDLRRVSNDLSPFVLGSLLELYAFELFRRGQERKIPTLLVLEEAHNYLRSVATGDSQDSSLAYERLAKEGRKFGLALWLSTQRPSEISPTVLSQCNNWVSFRLTSEQDLAAVQAASEWADRREVKRIAGLARQTAIVFGGSIAMPTLVKAATANPTPRSEDGAFDDWSALA